MPRARQPPHANHEWWAEKLARNVARDRGNDRELEAAGWRVVRVWEHEPMTEAADRICHEIRAGATRRSAADRLKMEGGGPLHPQRDDGSLLDATFELTTVPVYELLYHHKAGGQRAINADYHEGLELPSFTDRFRRSGNPRRQRRFRGSEGAWIRRLGSSTCPFRSSWTPRPTHRNSDWRSHALFGRSRADRMPSPAAETTRSGSD